ncbi:TIGR03943 family putative permease subunit [Robertmurraya massiliosenegalensis]|uniref:TIGR03943 family putative permease subunit n=1 Tax=Robertmurraya massiliosenegalensis TaxID=1287657 RepID=UPI0002D5B822|nr:TIGR03943 family protein [Robertmurraya massiliosenegalensis]
MIRIHFQHFLKAVLLASFALFFIKLHVTGNIANYINPKYDLMSLIAAWVFIILFFIQLFRIWEGEHVHEHCSPSCSHDHDGGGIARKIINYMVIVFPLITGFAFSPTILNASIAANKGPVLPHLSHGENHTEVIDNENYMVEEEYEQKLASLGDLEQIEMTADMFSSYHGEMLSNPEDFVGRKIRLSGFVYREQGIAENQLILSRFLITHCIADASVLGMLTEFSQVPDLKEDTWLELEGILDMKMLNGVVIPVIHASNWKVIDEPQDPYVYPVLVKIL